MCKLIDFVKGTADFDATIARHDCTVYMYTYVYVCVSMCYAQNT